MSAVSFRSPPAQGRPRRKGSGGRWEVYVDGKWVGEAGLEAWETTQRLGTQKAAAAALGVSPPALNLRMAAYEQQTGHEGPRPGAARAGRKGGRRPKANGAATEPISQHEREHAMGMESSSTPPADRTETVGNGQETPPAAVVETGADYASDMHQAQPVDEGALEDRVYTRVLEYMEAYQRDLEAPESLSMVATHTADRPLVWPPYEHGFSVGWMQAALTIIAEGPVSYGDDLRKVARIGLRKP